MKYVMSDIHGRLDKYNGMLQAIDFSDEDELYVIGDVIDRGMHGIEILKDIMKRTNVHMIMGNHELMAIDTICSKGIISRWANLNLWWQNGYTSITPDDWNRLTNGVMNIFLNLCGSRDIRTGKITDSGSTISKSMSNNVKLSSFVSGALVAFLNGRLFDSSIDAGRFTTNNTNSGKIINYDLGVGRNLIFPQLLHVPGDISQAPTELLNYNNSNNACKFYVFMFPLNSLENYRKIYNIRRPNDEGNTNANVDTTGIKYPIIK